MAVTQRWDAAALRAGAAVCLMLAVPFSLIASVVIDDGSTSGWATLLALGSFAGFVVGSGVAAWRQERGTPLSHAMVAALAGFVAAQAVFSLIRALRGDEIRIGRILASLTLVVGAGLIGGFLGAWMHKQGVRPGTPRPHGTDPRDGFQS